MSLKSIIVLLLMIGGSTCFSQSVEINSGVLKAIQESSSTNSDGFLYKTLDNFVDARYILKKKGKIRSYYCFGLMNRSDNFEIEAYSKPNSLYPKKSIEYKNRVTSIYGGLRWQSPLFNSHFWVGNQINLGINFYRNENKHYLHPHDNDYMETGTGPYYLEVIHRSHLKMTLRYELLFGFNLNDKIAININCSVSLLPIQTDYKFTTNSSLYGDYFEKLFQSPDYHAVKTNKSMISQLGIGIKYQITKDEN